MIIAIAKNFDVAAIAVLMQLLKARNSNIAAAIARLQFKASFVVIGEAFSMILLCFYI